MKYKRKYIVGEETKKGGSNRATIWTTLTNDGAVFLVEKAG